MPTVRPVFHSSASFDLGAKNTGLFLVNHPAGAAPSAEYAAAYTIVQPADGDGLNYSTTNRRAVRHRLRGGKRFKLARRLVLQVIDALRKLKPGLIRDEEMHRTVEALSSLLKRRGFTRIESEAQVDPTTLDSVDPAVFADHETLGGFFSLGIPISTQWDALSQNPGAVEQLFKALPSAKDFGKYVTEQFPEFAEQKKLYADAIKVLSSEAKSIVMQLGLGHHHRSKYFEMIAHDMLRDTRLQGVFELFGSEERFKTFICNVSNLQLRALRWYFDEPNPEVANQWNPEKFQVVWLRGLKYFHPDAERKADMKKLIDELTASKDILDALCTTDPRRTIPPYEDQNNRRPPFDQTLWLSAAELTRRYGDKWRIWSQKFERADRALSTGLDEILLYTDRRSRMFNRNQDPSVYADSYVLQRVLDRSSKLDRYALRALAAGYRTQELHEPLATLSDTLGTQHVETFLTFAAEYYEEVAAAKNGLWLDGPSRLLERADIHPPMKKKVLDLLLGNILDATPEIGRILRTVLWNRHVHEKSRSTPASLCRSIEAIRKDFGGEFRMRYDALDAKIRAAEDQKKKFKPTNAEEKDLFKAWNATKTMHAFLRDVLQLTPKQLERTASPYVFAQLHTLIDTERDGFTSTSLAAHLENHWRMRANAAGMAQCSRLPADAVRPFDGVLSKALDRQAFEAAKLAAQHLMSRKELTDTDIRYSIIIESNRFAFSASTAELKKNTLAKKNAEKGLNFELKRWQDKDSRIREASRGICAYTGAKLGDVVEYDHIIPRAFTTSAMGSVFNSEANLICVSRPGNQTKADKRYGLNKLHKTYLTAVFGTADVTTIAASIEDIVGKLASANRLRHFELLNEKEQDAVRHALFLDDESDARRIVLRELAAQNKSRVNGTQAWFVRAFMTKLLEITKDWRERTGNTLDIRSWKTDAEVASRLRSALAAINPVFTKTHPQPVASHSVDAMCAYAAACGLSVACSHLGADENFADAETYADGESLLTLHPQNVGLINVRAREFTAKDRHDSRPIFKERIYGDHFLPIIQMKNRIYIGYQLPKADGTGGNAVAVLGKDPLELLETLKPFLDREPQAFSDHPVTYKMINERAYELLTKCALTPDQTTELERTQAEVLRYLNYQTSRAAVLGRLVDDKNKFVAKDAVWKEKDFVISFKLSPKKSAFKASGQLELPAKSDWKALVDSPELAINWGQPADDTFSQRIERKVRMNSSHLEHTPKKRVVSLPVVDKPSGGFRIRRHNLDGSAVFQVHTVANNKYGGFSADSAGKVDWSTPVLCGHLQHANLVPLDPETASAEQLVRMSEWRVVETTSDIRLEVCPGTSGRRYVRVELPFTLLQEWLTAGKVADVPVSPLHLPGSIKLTDPKTFCAEAQKTLSIFAQPRATIFFEQLGDRVRFRFEASGGPATMNAAYNAAGRS